MCFFLLERTKNCEKIVVNVAKQRKFISTQTHIGLRKKVQNNFLSFPVRADSFLFQTIFNMAFKLESKFSLNATKNRKSKKLMFFFSKKIKKNNV